MRGCGWCWIFRSVGFCIPLNVQECSGVGLRMRIALQSEPGSLRLVEETEIFYIEAEDDRSRVRLGGKRLISDRRSLVEWERLLEGRGFVRIHRSYLANLNRIRWIRRRKGDRNDWELKLDPPVRAVLPLSRPARRELLELLGV